MWTRRVGLVSRLSLPVVQGPGGGGVSSGFRSGAYLQQELQGTTRSKYREHRFMVFYVFGTPTFPYSYCVT